jgi:Tol biopolymer transport system component
LNFSPDGDYLYFTRYEPGSQELKFLYRAPVLGGTPQKLVTDIDSRITFSPDGKEFAYIVYNNPDVGKNHLIVQPLEGGQPRVLASRSADARFDDPAWSPDGKTIVGISGIDGDAISTILAVDAKDGKMHPVFSSKDAFLSLPVWSPDGRGLLLLARDKSSNFTRGQIMFLPYPEGKPIPVTRDTNSYSALSVAADGRTIATVLNETHSNVFITSPLPNGGQPKQVTTGGPAFNLSWIADGQLIADQDLTLARINPDSGAKTPLVTGQNVFAVQPSVCADGRFIAFSGRDNSNQKLTQNIWRVDTGGGNLKQLSSGKLDVNPVCSPDGRFVLYNDAATGNKLAKVPLDGGASQIISDELIVGFDVSPDSKLVGAISFHHAGGHEEKLVLISMDTGQVVKTLDLERPRQGSIRFTNDGKAIAYPILTGEADNLWLQPLDGSPGKQITAFNSERIFDFHWSRDGSKLGLTRGHTDSDVVLIRDSQR